MRARPPGSSAGFAFVPHSGPFARGIHVTVQAPSRGHSIPQQVLGTLRAFYAGCALRARQRASAARQRRRGSNYAHLSAVTTDGTVAVMCAMDNLTKGAAGGALQWMNRMFALPESAGLTAPAPGWT